MHVFSAVLPLSPVRTNSKFKRSLGNEKMASRFQAVTFYGKRLAAAMEYIDEHLAEPLPLAVLSAKASFSPSHFHKIFTQWMGEPPQAYLRRCRFERAAALLHYGSGLTIKEIAPQCGFKSPEAFDRAFHAYFEMTPTEWRANGDAHRNKSARNSSPASLGLSEDQVQIKVFQPCQVIYKRKVGPYMDGETKLWSELADLVASLDIRGEDCFGIRLDDPAVTPTHRCRFDGCIKLPPLKTISRPVPISAIPGGYHAVLPYSGPAGDSADHWAWLLESWLPKSGFKISEKPCFEHYTHGMPKAETHVDSELCVPIIR